MTDALGSTLLQLARSAIAHRFAGPAPVIPAQPELAAPGATFVTLTQNHQLRGCIGSLAAYRPLGEDVCANACAAAFQDPRFRPLGAEELPRTHIEVSLLSAPQALSFTDEADALARLRPHVDGVIFTASGRRSTFLPQVWEQLPTPEEFMAHLEQKAGLSPRYWGADVRLERYTVHKWEEEA